MNGMASTATQSKWITRKKRRAVEAGPLLFAPKWDPEGKVRGVAMVVASEAAFSTSFPSPRRDLTLWGAPISSSRPIGGGKRSGTRVKRAICGLCRDSASNPPSLDLFFFLWRHFAKEKRGPLLFLPPISQGLPELI